MMNLIINYTAIVQMTKEFVKLYYKIKVFYIFDYKLVNKGKIFI